MEVCVTSYLKEYPTDGTVVKLSNGFQKGGTFCFYLVHVQPPFFQLLIYNKILFREQIFTRYFMPFIK